MSEERFKVDPAVWPPPDALGSHDYPPPLEIQVGICLLFSIVLSRIVLEKEVGKIRVQVVPRGPERAISLEKPVLGQPVVVHRVTKLPVKGLPAPEEEVPIQPRHAGLLEDLQNELASEIGIIRHLRLVLLPDVSPELQDEVVTALGEIAPGRVRLGITRGIENSHDELHGGREDDRVLQRLFSESFQARTGREELHFLAEDFRVRGPPLDGRDHLVRQPEGLGDGLVANLHVCTCHASSIGPGYLRG